MNSKVINTLEFNKILDMLSTKSSTYIGRALCHNTQLSKNIKEIEKRLSQTTQMQNLILRLGNVPLSPISDIEKHIKKIEIGGILSFKELLEIAHVLKISREIKQYVFNENNLNLEEYNLIIKYFENMYSNPRIENLILDNILDEENINDKASTKLYDIRKNIKQIEDKIRNTLNNYITSPLYIKYLQDTVITIKNGRFVIPVKQEYKSNIKGLLHDTSASGSTLFIEPNNIIEMNNNIRGLQNEEKNEIEKIIYSYCTEIDKFSKELLNNINLIGIIDYISAKANFALDNNMFEPIVNNNKYIKLIDARHPLIDKNKVIPISLEIDNNYTSMIITGPNTGGKTVTLKTVGLLTLMTQYGMHIPAKSGSHIAVFDNIFTDIGDEQSIEQNLSTFSSHMVNIINITKKITDNSLVIIDELGSGTDPVEGAALAIGILEFLNTKNSLTLCTTHYSELKTYAMSKTNILNACMEFDIKTLKPTYKLILGIPGKSNAFAICQKLGLDKNILDNSSTYITKNIVDFEDLLAKINAEKNEIEKIKRNTQSEYSKIKLESDKIQKEKEQIEKQKTNILDKAKKEARELLLSAKQEINDMIEEIKQSDVSEIQTKRAKSNKKINDKISNLSNEKELKKQVKNSIKLEDLKIGQTIYIPNLDKQATILNIQNKNNIQVQIGIIKTNIKLNEIELTEKQEKENTNIKIQIQNKAQTISSSINVIGKNIEEAIIEIDKYLDDAYISKIGIVTIVHGKGTGKLKDGIHNYLKKNKYIKSFRLGNYSEGQNGVTIVEMK